MDLQALAGADHNGFGVSSFSELADLKKALDIGYGGGGPGVGFDGLRVESLDSTLRIMTYTAQHMRMWATIAKDTSYSTVEEYNRLLAYGGDGGGFVQSGELPQEEDSVYDRADQKVKYLGTTRSITHPATLVRTVPADLVSQETQNGALWLMGKLNHALYYGDSDVIPQEFNSITKQIADGGGIVIDMKGQPLDSASIEAATYQITDNFGLANNIFSNGKVFSDFGTQYNQAQRFLGPNVSPGYVGTPMLGVKTAAGDVTFQQDRFIRKGKFAPVSASSLKAPNAPSLTIGTPLTAQTGSAFNASDAGDYRYQVTAVNQYGESPASAISSPVSVTANGSIPLTITDNGGSVPATGYKLYRSNKNGTQCISIQKGIPRAKSGQIFVSTTTFNDLNQERPGTYIALLLDLTVQSMVFKQLSPMIKMNLALIGPAIRWMQLLYGTPIVFAPKKNVVFKNIGEINSIPGSGF